LGWASSGCVIEKSTTPPGRLRLHHRPRIEPERDPGYHLGPLRGQLQREPVTHPLPARDTQVQSGRVIRRNPGVPSGNEFNACSNPSSPTMSESESPIKKSSSSSRIAIQPARMCENLGRKAWIRLAGDKGALCLSCADLDHLAFLPSGDTALTRRAKKYSGLTAVCSNGAGRASDMSGKGYWWKRLPSKRPRLSAFPTLSAGAQPDAGCAESGGRGQEIHRELRRTR